MKFPFEYVSMWFSLFSCIKIYLILGVRTWISSTVTTLIATYLQQPSLLPDDLVIWYMTANSKKKVAAVSRDLTCTYMYIGKQAGKSDVNSLQSKLLMLSKVRIFWEGHKIWKNLPLKILWRSQNIWTLPHKIKRRCSISTAILLGHSIPTWGMDKSGYWGKHNWQYKRMEYLVPIRISTISDYSVQSVTKSSNSAITRRKLRRAIPINCLSGGWAMFSIHARNSSLQIDPLTLTVFDHFASFFLPTVFKVGLLGRRKNVSLQYLRHLLIILSAAVFFVLRHPVLLKLPNTEAPKRSISR